MSIEAQLLEQILIKLTEMSNTMAEISDKIDFPEQTANNIDDVVVAINEGADAIVGERRYSLSDLFDGISDIKSGLEAIDTTLMMKD